MPDFIPTAQEQLKFLKNIQLILQSGSFSSTYKFELLISLSRLAIEKGELHRNFQGYTTKGGADLIGIGVTSIGNGVDYYAQNFKDLNEWEEAIDNGNLPVFKGYRLSDDDILRQYVIMELMSNFSLNIKKVEEEFKIDFKDYFSDALKSLKEFEDAELLKIYADRIEVSQTGTMLIRNICMPFDAYLNKIPEDKRRFSKTI